MGEILVQETYNKYGYWIKDLKPNSCKLVIWRCLSCNTIFDKKFRDAKLHELCLNCSNKINATKSLGIRSEKIKKWHKNNEHPLKGTKRPQNVLDALKKARSHPMSEEAKLKLSRTMQERKPNLGRKHTEESLIKMSKIQKIKARRGKESNLYGRIYHSKGDWYTNKENIKIWMRSSWELKYAQYLDSNNIEWEYEYKHFDLVVNNKEVSYTPDFYLIKENKYIEIKGYWRDDAKDKFDSFKEQYPNICIDLLMKKELKELKVL